MPAPCKRVERLNASLLVKLPSLLKLWPPAERATGAEWTELDPRQNNLRPGSCRINLRSRGRADFATNEGGGDPVPKGLNDQFRGFVQ